MNLLEPYGYVDDFWQGLRTSGKQHLNTGNKKATGWVASSFAAMQLARPRETGERERWQRLTLPRSHPRSTISARELNCRVRDGAGWTLTADATNTPFPLPTHLVWLPNDVAVLRPT